VACVCYKVVNKTRIAEHKKAVSLFDHNSKVACHVHENNHQMDVSDVKVVGHEVNFQERLFLEAWLSTKDHNAGNDHIVIPEVYTEISGSCLSPAKRLKHYAQLVNNFVARACTCHNFKSRVITISFQTDEGLSVNRNVF